MKEISSKVYQDAFINLQDAFTRFFKKLAEYPRFKKKYQNDSFGLDNSGKPIKLGGLRHKLPFIGWVKTFETLPECVIKKVTISRQAGDWYLSGTVVIEDLNVSGMLKNHKLSRTVGLIGIACGAGAADSPRRSRK